ncbi:Uncharacterized protein Adt_46495 [Abeliophyllum distichum]|uniref:Uncharacterized protein n=1 Tax=Abeliophyllum distichum TaxID=126358 RepID=A0ABD1NZX6_9LAMI
MCSECGLQGHNKRYHLRSDAPAADWYTAPVEQVENEGENQRPGKKKAKLTPRRSSTNASNQPHKAQSGFQFMPTPGVDMRNAGVIISSRLSASSPVIEGNSKGKNTARVIRIEDINISTMVEELEILNAEESARS